MSQTFSESASRLNITFSRLMRELIAGLPFRKTILKVDIERETKMNQLLTDFEDAWLVMPDRLKSLLKADVDDLAMRHDRVIRCQGALSYIGRTLDKLPEIARVLRAAKLYVVARDEGLDAAMLWKLAN